MSLIQVCSLTRRDRRSRRLLLDHVDLTIEPGARIGVVGSTGSGKSSLLRAIAMLDRCETGEVIYHERTVEKDAVPEFRRRVVYLAQRPAFVPGTVRQNLEQAFLLQHARSMGLDRDQVAARLNLFDQPVELMQQPVDQLSGGQQQIVALIRAMSVEPEVLLLDEPTASLDSASAEAYERVVLEWHAGSGQHAFVWAGHDLNQIVRTTTQRFVMRGGVLGAESSDA